MSGAAICLFDLGVKLMKEVCMDFFFFVFFFCVEIYIYDCVLCACACRVLCCVVICVCEGGMIGRGVVSTEAFHVK